MRAANRHVVNPPEPSVFVRLRASSPAQADVVAGIGVEVPRDCGAEDEIVLSNREGGEVFVTSMADLVPAISPALELRLRLLVQRLGAELLEEVRERAERSLREKGY